MTAGNDPRPLVRPYTVTRGRTATAAAWPPETVIATIDRPTTTRRAAPDAARGDLVARVRGVVLLPGERGFREEVGSAAEPRLVLGARDRDDVAAGLAVAAVHDLRVVVGTGGAPEPDDERMLISTMRMGELTVDPVRQSVRVGAGVTWKELAEAAIVHGFVAPSGWDPELTVVDQTLRGGLGPWARPLGFAADWVAGLELVTADGARRWVDTAHEIELFWALRGGMGGSRPFGVVTAVELGLSDATERYGGVLTFDGSTEELGEVLDAYPGWSASLDEATTSVLSWGRGVGGLRLRVHHAGPVGDGEAAVAAMRARGPAVDTVAPLPASEPTGAWDGGEIAAPRAGWARGLLLRELHPDVLALLAATLADPPTAVEVHQLGGATALRPTVDDAVGGRHARYAIVIVDGHGPDGGPTERGSRLLGALAPYAAGTATVTVGGSRIDVAADPDSATRARLADLADRHDPAGRFRTAHPVTGRHREHAASPALTASGHDGHAERASPATGGREASPPVTNGETGSDGGPEAGEILRLARPWRSVAEIAGTLGLPLGVVRVLVADLDEAGLVTVHRPPDEDDTDNLERVLRGLRNRL